MVLHFLKIDIYIYHKNDRKLKTLMQLSVSPCMNYPLINEKQVTVFNRRL